MDNLLYYHMLEGAPTIITKYSTDSRYIYVTTVTQDLWDENNNVWVLSDKFESERVMASASPTHKVYTSFTENIQLYTERTQMETKCRSYHLFNFSDVVGTVLSAKMNVGISTNNTNPVYTDSIILNKCNNTGTLVNLDFENINSTSLGYSNTKTILNGQFFFDIQLTSTAITQINQKGLYRICVLDYAYDYSNLPINNIDSAASVDVNASIVLTIQ